MSSEMYESHAGDTVSCTPCHIDLSYNTCYGVNYVDNLHGPRLGETSLADPMQHDDCIPA